MIEHIPEKERKSKGHLSFFGNYEYFEFNSVVFKAHKSDVVMPDGYRTGRWECTMSHWPLTKSVLEPAS